MGEPEHRVVHSVLEGGVDADAGREAAREQVKACDQTNSRPTKEAPDADALGGEVVREQDESCNQTYSRPESVKMQTPG